MVDNLNGKKDVISRPITMKNITSNNGIAFVNLEPGKNFILGIYLCEQEEPKSS